jgi:hypothetical protein
MDALCAKKIEQVEHLGVVGDCVMDALCALHSRAGVFSSARGMAAPFQITPSTSLGVLGGGDVT